MDNFKLPEINHNYDSDVRYCIESRLIMAIPYIVLLIAMGSVFLFAHIDAFDGPRDPKVLGVVLFYGFIYILSFRFTTRLLENSEYRARIRSEQKKQVI